MTAFSIHALDPAVPAFLDVRHLGVLVTLRADGSPHAVPVGFVYDTNDQRVRIITQAGSVKARNAAREGRATVTQVDGARWLTLEGTVRLATDATDVNRAIEAYTRRYQAPRSRGAATRVAIEIQVDRILGRV